MNDDFVQFDSEPDTLEAPATGEWPVLVVDDEPQVHLVTRLALDGFRYKGKTLRLIEASSGAEAIEILDREPDIALALLDVVMETDDAGFNVIRHIRDTQSNHTMRIILRTGQPGQAPAHKVVHEYEINDYHSKADLTAERMYVSIYTALAMFDQLRTIERREQELARANANIEHLVYVASHHLQEPLLSATSLTKRLLTANRKQLDEDGSRCVEYIGVAVRRMSDLVRDLLDYSKLAQPQPTETVQLADLVAELRQDMSTSIQDAGAQISCEELPPAQGQRLKLKMLLQNLISNAVKYHQPDVAPRIRIYAREGTDGPVFSVSDNGIGIPASHHDYVFDVFSRLDNTSNVRGTGIGLAHCKKIVEMHGGEIWVESESGSGTTVNFTLPGAPP